ncbi:hypothetical protein [Amycolatopsis sp. YIM 10]|nr:hypothetical protein [Amycolatopsis sp. YIM 10]
MLHLDSSAHRAGESVTRRLTDVFARRWLAGHPAGASNDTARRRTLKN